MLGLEGVKVGYSFIFGSNDKIKYRQIDNLLCKLQDGVQRCSDLKKEILTEEFSGSVLCAPI